MWIVERKEAANFTGNRFRAFGFIARKMNAEQSLLSKRAICTMVANQRLKKRL
jgi:hypothetical protein